MKGQVARVFDYYQSDEIDSAMMQLQAFSHQFGVPMVSAKFIRRLSFSSNDVMRQMLLNTYSTTAAIHTQYYDAMDNQLTATDLENFRLVLRVKYSMMAYTRSQVFKQMNTGVPVIRPMHTMKFDSIVDPTDTINSMYMFGPSILAQTNFDYSTRNYPSSNWCTVYGSLSQSLFCFNNQVNSKYNGQQLVFIN